MKTNILLWITIIVLSLLNMTLLYLYHQNRQKEQNYLIQQKQSFDNKREEVEFLKRIFLMQQASEGYSCEDIEVKSPKDKKNIPLYSLLKADEPVLFFRFKENDCDGCIQNTILLIVI